MAEKTAPPKAFVPMNADDHRALRDAWAASFPVHRLGWQAWLRVTLMAGAGLNRGAE